ncbi:uncharacterized protein LOC105436062 [Cucumis sativus]|uniref:uncharacterized protein LOC105436062 n=1 Tax=Cucumis sativus TaxID=3659 RepID=UPI0012F4F10F|nr:uncharacterized protein LOC105436062 [Cucumis sativus]
MAAALRRNFCREWMEFFKKTLTVMTILDKGFWRNSLYFLERRGDVTVGDVQKYLNSRKMIKKEIHKTLKGMERSSSQKSDESSEIVSMLKEAETVTYNNIESLLSFIAGSKLPSKISKWSFVSKFMQPKKVVSKEDDTSGNEVEMVDAALYSITSHKSDCIVQIEDVQILLRKLESSIQDLEEDLESLYRHLIKNRVAFLNILNH